jgi:hypothetical protein
MHDGMQIAAREVRAHTIRRAPGGLRVEGPPRLEHLGRVAVVELGRAAIRLGLGDIARVLHEGGELAVGHFMGLQPEGRNQHAPRRAFLREDGIDPHDEAAAGDVDEHSEIRGIQGASGFRRC